MSVRFHFAANGSGGQWSRREAVAKDPRRSLQERYGTHQGYVDAVTTAANGAVSQGYLLADDATALIAQAAASDVLNSTNNSSLPAYGEISIGTGDGDHDGDDHGAGTGEVLVRPGDTLSVGYSFSLPGKHAAATITIDQAQVTLQAECQSSRHHHDCRHHHHDHGEHHRAAGPIVVNIAKASYSASQNSSAWVPSANPRDASTFQGSTTVPDLCQGGAMEIGDGATFTAMVGSQ
jgi:hypothetical protein